MYHLDSFAIGIHDSGGGYQCADLTEKDINGDIDHHQLNKVNEFSNSQIHIPLSCTDLLY